MTEQPRGSFPWPDASDPLMQATTAVARYRRIRRAVPWLLLAAGLAVDAVLLLTQ